MKRSVLVLVVLIVVLVFSGCMTPRPTAEQKPSDLPEWYLNPPIPEDGYIGVGSARMSSLDSSRRMAVARAREDVAFQINAVVQSAITDYAQEAGVDDNNQVISFVETVSRQLTDTTLSGARPVNVAQGEDGTIYAMVQISHNEILNGAQEAFQRNEDAAFAEFKSQQALDRLQSELNNTQSTPGASGSSQ